LLEGGNPNARHHGKGLERATFYHGVELSYCLVTVRTLTETNIDNGLLNGVVYIDLNKAFDPIDHAILSRKLANYGGT